MYTVHIQLYLEKNPNRIENKTSSIRFVSAAIDDGEIKSNRPVYLHGKLYRVRFETIKTVLILRKR